jgi:rhomboid protease GluP
MPEKTEIVTVDGYDASRLLAIAYGSFEKLNWTIKYAGENILLAYTPRKWNVWDLEITTTTQDNQLSVTSKQIHNESFDMAGRNKKRIAEFLAAFNEVKPKATDGSIEEWANKINALQQDTIVAAQKEITQAEEINKVMNLGSSNLYLTYGIIAINVLVFIAMVIDGAGIMDLNPLVHIKWGSNFTALTLTGDWWRLLSSLFIHFGVIHVLMNMYALYMISVYLEPMLGKVKFITAYLCTGVFAGLLSLWWHKEGTNSAGASGAIFGMYGVFLALLTTKLIPAAIRNGLLQSIGVFVVFNLLYGTKGQIDNAAHIGGLLSGLVIGYLYWFSIKNKESQPAIGKITTPVIAFITFAAAYFYLAENKMSNETRNSVLMEVDDSKFKGHALFTDKYNEFVEWQDKAKKIFEDKQIGVEGFKKYITEVSYPAWNKADSLLDEMNKLTVSPNAHKKVSILKQYTELRRTELRLRDKYADAKDETVLQQLNSTIIEIDKLMEEFKKLQ